MTSCRPKRKKMNLTKGTTAVERSFPSRGGKVRAVVENVPALVCRGCREAVVAGEDLARAELIAASRLIDAGARSGALLSWTRRALGLLATDLAALLGITAETVSRWENDRVEPEPAVWNVVADLVADRLEGRTRTLGDIRGRVGKPGEPDRGFNRRQRRAKRQKGVDRCMVGVHPPYILESLFPLQHSPVNPQGWRGTFPGYRPGRIAGAVREPRG
jgi:transcriptional regulator with XRE-family HTH domain